MPGQFSFGRLLLKRRRQPSTDPACEQTPRKTPRSRSRDRAGFGFGNAAVAAGKAAPQAPQAWTAPRRPDLSGAAAAKLTSRRGRRGPRDVEQQALPGQIVDEAEAPVPSQERSPLWADALVEDETMHVRWSEALAGRSAAELSGEELRRLLVAGGVPLKHRHSLWPRFFLAPSEAAPGGHQGRVSEEAAAQIEADVQRTRPQQLGPDERASLRRVLRAYAASNPAVGYCQGMNNIAAVFILLGFDEATSLRGCYTLMDGCCPGYHDRDLAGLRPDARVLEALAEQHLPADALRRLLELGVPLEVLMSEHLLTLASHSWPLAAVARLWDVILQEGTPAVFASVLAVLKLFLVGPEEKAPKAAKAGKASKVLAEDDEEDWLDAFRARASNGVAENFETVLAEVRRLTPLISQSDINRLRFDLACGRTATN